MSTVKAIRYNPSPTAVKFHKDNNGVRAIAGPVGSGKSVSMMMEIVLRGLAQNAVDGVRDTKWAIVRSTYAELKNTTMKTWGQWVPESIAPIVMSVPPICKVSMPLADGTIAKIEVIFLALDREQDQAKLRSLEVTGIYFNEAQFVNAELVRVGEQRTGRYPKVKQLPDGTNDPNSGATWSGMIMDFNMTDTNHFLYTAFKTEQRQGWKLWVQPGALQEAPDPDDPTKTVWVPNPMAENIQNLANPGNGNDGYNYYLQKIPGMKRTDILVDFCAKWGITSVGQPVYANSYDDDEHIAEKEIAVDKTLPLLLGMDFGLHPAIVFGQMNREGTLIILGELDPNDPAGVALEVFIDDYYRPYIYEFFNGVKSISGWGDPAGTGRSDIDKRTRYTVLAANGVSLKPARTNNFLARKEAVESLLMKRKGIKINPSCVRLRKGFLGGYGYKKINGVAKLDPEKNGYSHPHDALQYLIHGMLNEYKTVAISTHEGKGVAF